MHGFFNFIMVFAVIIGLMLVMRRVVNTRVQRRILSGEVIQEAQSELVPLLTGASHLPVDVRRAVQLLLRTLGRDRDTQDFFEAGLCVEMKSPSTEKDIAFLDENTRVAFLRGASHTLSSLAINNPRRWKKYTQATESDPDMVMRAAVGAAMAQVIEEVA